MARDKQLTRFRDPVLKQSFDVIASAAGLLVLSPLFIAISLAVKLNDGGPVFYRARRVGRGGRLFRLYKFRTMRVDADKKGPGITASGDTRITRIGRWLRRTKLDELPQLLNVLLGDMSLVGPRPEDPRYVALYTPEQRQVLSVRPGITSAASLAYRNEEQLLTGPNWETVYREEVMPAKLAIDLEYLSQRTLQTDIQLILRTIGALPK
jgi:lipopolysaccharide/colanic/teichoic acid biosynthesis glycosyltransferase